MRRLCIYYTVLYKGPEHLRGGPGTNPPADIGGRMYVHILIIRLQMLGRLSFFSCACGLAATKGEGKENIKVLNKEGKTNAKHMERRRQHVRKWQLLS